MSFFKRLLYLPSLKCFIRLKMDNLQLQYGFKNQSDSISQETLSKVVYVKGKKQCISGFEKQ